MTGVMKPLFGTKLILGHPLAQGIVADWLFNEGSGNKAYDSSEQNNHVTLTNISDPPTSTSGWGPGQDGSSLVFDGVDDYIDAGGDILVFGTGNCSFVFQFSSIDKTNAYGNFGRTEYGDMASRYGSYIIGGTLSFYYHLPSFFPEIFMDCSSYLDGNPHTMVAIVNRRSYLSLYMDNIIKGSMDISAYSADNMVSGLHFFIGAYGNSTGHGPLPGYYFPGKIYRLAVYNRALSAQEVAYLYAFPYCMYDEPDYPAWMCPPGGVLFRRGMTLRTGARF